MPETLDPFVYVIDAAFAADLEEIDVDDDPATTLLEFLSSAAKPSASPARRPSGRLVSLIVGRDQR